MQEEYQREMNKLHAPQQLVDSTKELVKQEEKKYKSDVVVMKKRVATIGAIAACFLIACIVVPFILPSNENNESVYLGDSNTLGPVPIEKGEETPNEGLDITELVDYPAEFSEHQVEEILLKDTTIKLKKDEKTGYYKACLIIKDNIFFADSKLKDRELFLDKLEVFIDSKNEDN